MSTTQYLYKVRQSESRRNMVERIPIKEGQKLSTIKELNQQYTWEDLRGLTSGFEDEVL